MELIWIQVEWAEKNLDFIHIQRFIICKASLYLRPWILAQEIQVVSCLKDETIISEVPSTKQENFKYGVTQILHVNQKERLQTTTK